MRMNEGYSRIFLSGICGTAMASLAGMLKARGYDVSGSDAAVYPPMSTFLEQLGISVFEGFSEQNIEQVKPDLVVDDSLEVPAALGGYWARPYFFERHSSDDDEMEHVYRIITEYVRDGYSKDERFRGKTKR